MFPTSRVRHQYPLGHHIKYQFGITSQTSGVNIHDITSRWHHNRYQTHIKNPYDSSSIISHSHFPKSPVGWRHTPEHIIIAYNDGTHHSDIAFVTLWACDVADEARTTSAKHSNLITSILFESIVMDGESTLKNSGQVERKKLLAKGLRKILEKTS